MARPTKQMVKQTFGIRWKLKMDFATAFSHLFIVIRVNLGNKQFNLGVTVFLQLIVNNKMNS